MDVYLAYASRGRNAWWRYLLCPVLACLLAAAMLIVIGVGLMLAHLMPQDLADQVQHPELVTPFYLGIAATFGFLTIGLMLAMAMVHRKRPADVIGQWRWTNFAWGFWVWLIVQTVLALIDFLIAPKGFALSAGPGTVALAVVAFIGILIQTFAEEFIFRGYMTQGLLLLLKQPLPAAIVSGLLFGSLHIANGIPQALNATVFGIVCALIAIRTGGIALTFGLHLANNYFGAVAVVSGSDVFKGSPGIITQTTPHLLWWDLFLAVLVLAAVPWLIFRRRYFSAMPAG
ncbi:MAG TPA: CPBP family intramembrane glutamic endopeptidase [Rhizomicrobium sp.]|nr:CPBP family intramembrane glutamic endopeptidase [Rhizomicrobium sp.]